MAKCSSLQNTPSECRVQLLNDGPVRLHQPGPWLQITDGALSDLPALLCLRFATSELSALRVLIGS